MEKGTGQKAVYRALIIYLVVVLGVISLAHTTFSYENASVKTRLTTSERYKRVAPGDEMVTELKLYNFSSSKRVDIILNYEIQDSEGDVILKQQETVAIETQASFLGNFTLPANLEVGRYIIFAKVIDLNELVISTATTSFEVAKPIAGYSESTFAFQPSARIFYGISAGLFLCILALLLISNQRKEIIAVAPKEKPGYTDLIENIIKSNRFFGSDKATELANRIKGLRISPEGKVVEMAGKPVEIIINLIDLYRITIGDSSIKIAREAIKWLLRVNPDLKVPTELKFRTSTFQ